MAAEQPFGGVDRRHVRRGAADAVVRAGVLEEAPHEAGVRLVDALVLRQQAGNLVVTIGRRDLVQPATVWCDNEVGALLEQGTDRRELSAGDGPRERCLPRFRIPLVGSCLAGRVL
jgi:hypothetical protein